MFGTIIRVHILYVPCSLMLTVPDDEPVWAGRVGQGAVCARKTLTWRKKKASAIPISAVPMIRIFTLFVSFLTRPKIRYGSRNLA